MMQLIGYLQQSELRRKLRWNHEREGNSEGECDGSLSGILG